MKFAGAIGSAVCSMSTTAELHERIPAPPTGELLAVVDQSMQPHPGVVVAVAARPARGRAGGLSR